MQESVITDGIYAELRHLAAMKDTEQAAVEFEELVSQVQVLTKRDGKFDTPFGRKRWNGKKYVNYSYIRNGKLKSSEILSLMLTANESQAINSTVDEGHGQAMWSAIETEYGSLMETRTPFNTAIQTTTAMYNVLIQAKVNALMATKDTKYRMTKADMDQIREEIYDVFPKVRTPFYDPTTDQGYLEIATKSRDKDYEYTYAEQTQTYKNNMTEKTSQPMHTMFLKNPGVAPVLKMIHMTDATAMNMLMGDESSILSAHDGVITSIDEASQSGNDINEHFLTTMADYSIGIEAQRTLDTIRANFEKHMSDLGLPSGDLLMDQYLDFGNIVTLDHIQTAENFDKKAFWVTYNNFTRKGKSNADAMKAAIKDFITSSSPEYQTELLINVTENLDYNVARMAQQTDENKKVFMDAVTKMAQYSNQGDGFITGKEMVESLFGFSPLAINSYADDSVIAKAGSIKNLASAITVQPNELGSTPNSNQVSKDINDYPDTQQVDGLNAIGVFDRLTQMDQDAGVSTIQDSPTHTAHLKGLLGKIVTKVMNPIDLYMQQNGDPNNRETMGLYAGDNKIFISTQRVSPFPLPGFLAQGLRMSVGQTYAHELVHHITHGGLLNRNMYNQVLAIYKQADKHLTETYGAGNEYQTFLNDPSIDVTDQAYQYEVAAAKKRYNYIFNPKQNVTTKVDPLTKETKTTKTNNGLDEFMAHGLTDENFMRELASMTMEDATFKMRPSIKGIWKGNIQATIVGIFSRMMDLFYQGYHKQKHSANVAKELENLAITMSTLDSKKKNAIWQYVTDLDLKLMALSDIADSKIVKTVKESTVGKLAAVAKKVDEAGTKLDNCQARNCITYCKEHKSLF